MIDFKFDLHQDVFVKIDNAAIYKTIIKDIRVIVDETGRSIRPFVIEYQVKNTSKDCPTLVWVEESKIISMLDINTLVNLDNNL